MTGVGTKQTEIVFGRAEVPGSRVVRDEFYRYSLPALQFDRAITVFRPPGTSTPNIYAVEAVPGVDDLIVVAASGEAALYKDGAKLPDTVGSVSVVTLLPIDPSLAYVKRNNDMVQLDLGPTGITHKDVVLRDAPGELGACSRCLMGSCGTGRTCIRFRR